MRKIQFLLIAVLAAMQVSAANVDLAAAQAKAESFLKSQNSAGKMMASAPIKFVSQRTITNSLNVNVPVYYIFNTQDRFVIVSGDDRSEEILACGDTPLDFNNIPSNMQNWLNFYQKQIEYLQARPGMVVEVQSRLNAPNRAQSVAPLLTARWDQTTPFWNQCIINGKQCLTGCPATSLAMVFNYWKYPTGETGIVPAYRFREGYSWVNVPALPSTTFDWPNMRDYYGWSGNTGTAAQKAAVATLMRYIGQAEHMEYGTDGSGISSDSTVLIANACKFFGYDNSVRAVRKTNYYGTWSYYSDTQWANLIQAELVAGHPIVYCAISDEGQGGGHAFNVDGYTASSNLYHINWGWGGSGNGDFALNAFTDYDGMTFDIYQQMVIGIQPPGGQVTFPVLTVEPESIDFGSMNTGETVTRTFTVSGINLLGDVTFTKTGDSNFVNAVTISPETLTAEEVAAGATVTVTYSPLVGGNFNGAINVASSGAETRVINMTANATAIPMLVADPNEMSFNTSVGETVTGTFNLRGYNLTKVVYLKVVDATAGSGFAVDKSNATAANVKNGISVTVTFAPTQGGNHSARVMVRSAGADTIYVNLNGTAAGVTTYDPVMQPANADYVTSTSFRADWTDQTPAEAVSSYTLQYTGNGETATVNGITGKYYVLENLTAGALYSYKVMANYADGTQSNWSNVQEVTLLQDTPYIVGDVDLDGTVGINDVTALIDYLLGGGDVFLNSADIDGNGQIQIDDVTSLIDMLLSGGN